MMMENAFTRLVSCRFPIQLAAMPGVGTVELAAAVSNAGGLGMVGTPLIPPPVLEELLLGLKQYAEGPFGANFLIPFLDLDCVDVAARHCRVVEFFYGDPDPTLIDRVHQQKALASWQVGSLDEARAAEKAGCDFIIVQGTEAGGHIRGTTSILPLLSAVCQRLRIPVLAAGGISTGRDLAAVLAAGAAGVRVGTRFAASEESGAHPEYVAALLKAEATDTAITEAFSVMWPEAPHRVLRSAVEAARNSPEDPVGEIDMGGQRLPVPRLSVICPTRQTEGNINAMALYAGESVANIHEVLTCREIIEGMVAEATQLLADSAPDE